MKIRLAQAGDEAAIANVIVTTWKDAYRGIVPDDYLAALTPDRRTQTLRDNMQNKKEIIYVLENEAGQIVGMASGGEERSGEFDCEIVAIYILPAYQHKGYGKKLAQKLIEQFKHKNYRSMVIWTFKKNRDQVFYQKLGGIRDKEKTLTISTREIPVVGYVWPDIAAITI